MPKRKGSGEPARPERKIGKSLSLESPTAEAPQGLKTVGSEDVIDALKGIGRGWTEDIRGLLSLPPRLFMKRSDEGTLYSRDLRFGIEDVLASMDSGSLKARMTDYGIAVYSTGGGEVLLVFADLGRRVVIREKLFSIHDKPPEKDWKGISGRMQDALSIAAPEKEGTAILWDEIIRKVKVSPP